MKQRTISKVRFPWTLWACTSAVYMSLGSGAHWIVSRSSRPVFFNCFQETRVSEVVDVMILLVENLKRTYQKEHTELEEARYEERLSLPHSFMLFSVRFYSRKCLRVSFSSSTSTNLRPLFCCCCFRRKIMVRSTSFSDEHGGKRFNSLAALMRCSHSAGGPSDAHCPRVNSA